MTVEHRMGEKTEAELPWSLHRVDVWTTTSSFGLLVEAVQSVRSAEV